MIWVLGWCIVGLIGLLLDIAIHGWLPGIYPRWPSDYILLAVTLTLTILLGPLTLMAVLAFLVVAPR